MYEWLQQEIDTIQTNKFHCIQGPADAKRRRALRSTKTPAPASYKAFVRQFGSTELYRYDGLDLYYVSVYAELRQAKGPHGEVLYEMGRGDRHFAYFKQELLAGENESPVFERIEPSGYLLRAGESFAEWLLDRCRRARKKYGKRRWAEIVSGPPPFSDFEQAIVAARRRYRWRRVGTTKSGDIEFEVHNGSTMVLPYLSIGIDDRDGVLGGGGVFLPVGSIKPGQTKRLAFDCYKDFVPPGRIKAFALPDPGPEDRNFYWEFRTSPPRQREQAGNATRGKRARASGRN